jgi:hypothetical protein
MPRSVDHLREPVQAAAGRVRSTSIAVGLSIAWLFRLQHEIRGSQILSLSARMLRARALLRSQQRRSPLWCTRAVLLACCCLARRLLLLLLLLVVLRRHKRAGADADGRGVTAGKQPCGGRWPRASRSRSGSSASHGASAQLLARAAARPTRYPACARTTSTARSGTSTTCAVSRRRLAQTRAAANGTTV